MIAEFGYTGDTTAGDEVTEGTYIPPTNTDKYTKLFLSCLSRPDNIQDNMIPTKFSTQDYVTRWKLRRKRTSSSVSGRYFGHYKMLHILPKRYQDIFASMANIPYHTGYLLKRWQKVIDVLIMKKEGNYRVHRTRPIPLKEADEHDNSKRMSKDASIIADKYNLLADEQYGKFHGNVINLATTK